jgi:hypothetical protein
MEKILVKKIEYYQLIIPNNVYILPNDTNWLKVYDVLKIITDSIKNNLIKIYI